MDRNREELRDELLVLLASSRELSPDTDEHLAETFLRRLEQATPEHRQAGDRPRRHHADGSRIVLVVLATITSILLLTLVFGNDQNTPQPVFTVLWLAMIGAALAAVATMAWTVVCQQVERAIVSEPQLLSRDSTGGRGADHGRW